MAMAQLAPVFDKSALEDLCCQVEEFAAMTSDAQMAFEHEDAAKVIELSLRSRQARSDIERARKLYGTRLMSYADGVRGRPTVEVALLNRLKSAEECSRPGDELLQSWAQRDLPKVSSLLTSDQGALVYAEAMLPLIWDFSEDVVLLVGSGLQRVACVLEQMGQQRMVLFAPDDVDITGYPDSMVVVDTPDDMYAAVRTFHPNLPQRLVARYQDDPSISRDVFSELEIRAADAIRDAKIQRDTLSVFAEVWMEQAIKNLPRASEIPSIAAMGEHFCGKPMVIVAPGPSLQKNIDKIAQFKDRAIIVTFSHALKALCDAGITPDIVMTIDAKALLYHFDGCRLDNVGAMVSALTCNAQVLDMPAPRHYTLDANTSVDTWLFDGLDEDAFVPAGGSVATTAFALGLKLGCDPIVVCGLDLSFSDGKFYVGSSVDGDIRVDLSEDGTSMEMSGWSAGCKKMSGLEEDFDGSMTYDVLELDGYYGGKVATTSSLAMFHSWFMTCAHCNKGLATLYNCTEGGAYINGFEHEPLQKVFDDVVSKQEPFSVADLLDKGIAEVDFPKRTHAIIKLLQGMRTRIDRSTKLAAKAKKLTGKEDPDSMAELTHVEKKLQNKMREMTFISMLRQSEIEQASFRARSAQSVEECLTASRELFDVIIHSGKMIGEWIDVSLSGLRAKVGPKRGKKRRRRR